MLTNVGLKGPKEMHVKIGTFDIVIFIVRI